MYISIILLFIIIGYFSRRHEIKVWNNGVCAKNMIPWKKFDMTSQGGRGYNAGDEYCWITYPGVDK